MMPCHVDRLAPGSAFQLVALDTHFKAAEQHVPGGHLVHNGVQPIGQQDLGVRATALDRNRLARLHEGQVRDHGSHGERSLLEGLRPGGAEAAHADVCLMMEMLPPGGCRHSEGECKQTVQKAY
jgi:hypothetical protein